MQYSQTHAPVWWPTNGKIIRIAEVVPKEKGVQAPYQASQPGVPARGRWAPRASDFDNQWGLCSGEPKRAVANRDSPLKGPVQNRTHSKSQCRGSNLKGAWVRPTCWSWRASPRGRGQRGLPWGVKCRVVRMCLNCKKHKCVESKHATKQPVGH